MPDEFDAWETGTGLIDDYIGQVTSAHFSPNDQGKYQLVLELVTDHPDAYANNWIIEERYNVGDQWTSFDGGTTVEFPGNPTKKINSNSNYGKLLDKAVELAGDGIRAWGSPRTADTWVGSTWHMVNVKGSFTNPAGEKVSFGRNFPSEFLGKGPVTLGPGTSGQPPTGGTVALGSVRNQAIALAAKCNTHQEWVDACFSLTGFVEDAILVKEVADEGLLWTELKG